MKKVSMKEMRKKKKGFTLVELIIVIAIIAILAAMAIPRFSAVRMESRVSNDVAAAKNIHTITATLIANGTWHAGETHNSTDDVVTDRLDGPVAEDGLSEATGEQFDITINDKEAIIIQCGGNQLYPDNTGAGRTAYLTRANS